MKAIHLNLATRQHRDVAPVYTAAIVLGVLSAILMANNIQAAWRYLSNTEETRTEIARIQAEAAKQDQTAAALEAEAAKIDLKGLSAETKYINAQIANRAFSWSRLLDDLERVLPRDVRLTSLNPTIDESGRVNLVLMARGKSHDGLIDLLQNLQGDPKFEQAYPQSETRSDDGSYQFSIAVSYLPEGYRAALREVAR